MTINNVKYMVEALRSTMMLKSKTYLQYKWNIFHNQGVSLEQEFSQEYKSSKFVLLKSHEVQR